ncbi:multiple epidermal growth factor-like domains 10, partial [Plakobranchus ocellatus]
MQKINQKFPAYLDQFELSYQFNGTSESTPCAHPRTARVDERTVDISCPTYVVVSHVTVSGVIVTGLCSLYISGGRNVALKQTADQPRTLDSWYARNAVDGDPGIPDDYSSLSSTCSLTAPGLGDSAYWRVIFSNDVDINRNYSYTDPGGPAQQVYAVVPSPQIGFPVKNVYIHVRKNRLTDIIALCEVYAFGEVVCPVGKFGRQCERDCNCANQTEACFVSTGGCPSGCVAGYTGEDCYTPCEDGTYGPDCNQLCSANCAQSTDACNSIDGVCNGGCKPGYQAPLCNEPCPVGHFGLDCLQSCSDNCVRRENVCNHVTGECDSGCDPGYKTKQCNVSCEPGTYGENCMETCSDHCAGDSRSCHFVTGFCDQGCKAGYMMPLCTNAEGEWSFDTAARGEWTFEASAGGEWKVEAASRGNWSIWTT